MEKMLHKLQTTFCFITLTPTAKKQTKWACVSQMKLSLAIIYHLSNVPNVLYENKYGQNKILQSK